MLVTHALRGAIGYSSALNIQRSAIEIPGGRHFRTSKAPQPTPLPAPLLFYRPWAKAMDLGEDNRNAMEDNSAII